MTNNRLQDLFQRYLSKTATPEERGELGDLISEQSEEPVVYELLKDYWNTYQLSNPPVLTANEQAAMLRNILTGEMSINPQNPLNPINPLNPRPLNPRPFNSSPGARTIHRIHFLRTAWFKYAAAIIILFGIGAYLWNTINTHEDELVQHTEPVPSKNDVQPGSNRAVLTLSDGRKVELTPSTGNITEAGTTIENEDGRLKYSEGEKVVMNTMTTPRGGQYQLTLPDGTNVWLNAASSITYPTAFVNNIREVTITGEAFFEVTKNPSKPFVVKTPKEEITVLGTSFNVNAYPDEAAMKTSLLEGSVKVGEKVLKPGEAFVNGKVFQTNVEQDVAWKNGVFDFRNSSIEQAMRQLARWYDLDIVYENGKIPDFAFGGKMQRSLKLSQVLKGLETSGLRFRIEAEKKLIVTP